MRLLMSGQYQHFVSQKIKLIFRSTNTIWLLPSSRFIEHHHVNNYLSIVDLKSRHLVDGEPKVKLTGRASWVVLSPRRQAGKEEPFG